LPASNVSDSKEPAVLDVLPGITRKITACGACRKQKVCDESSVIWIQVNRGRSNVT
jgi:positive regulator of sigma E activity